LAPPDLLDPQLINEVRTALDRLTQILRLESIYDFQKE
jgi:succinylarginine dihydrolase